MKILIAEDEFTTRESLAGLLKKWGFEPLMAQDGKEAWEALQRPDAPKLVILDWMMPLMDGIDICRQLRQSEKDKENPTYIILLTSLGKKKYMIEGFEAGADDYIIKPFDEEELHARINVGKRMVGIQSDLKCSIESLTFQATYDLLTRTYNRHFILEMLTGEIERAKRESTGLSIGLIDIDKFKMINDTYGHQSGDDVLIETIHRIKKTLRSYDMLGRMGGDEFLLLNPGGAPQNIIAFHRRICESVSEKQIPTRNGPISVTVSIGASLFSGNLSADDMIATADKALYQAKKQGRNQVSVL